MKRNLCISITAALLFLVLFGGYGASFAKGQMTFAEESEKLSAGVQEAASATGVTSKESEKEAEHVEVSEDEIENNGGFFVRVGNKVYFRRYGQKALDSNALFGHFLDYGQADGSSVMLSYDLVTGEVAEAFEDAGYYRMYAGDGGFYCRKAGDGYHESTYWVSLDGTQSVDFGQAVALGISEGETKGAAQVPDAGGKTSEKTERSPLKNGSSFVALEDRGVDHAGDLFILHGGEETARAESGENITLEFCGMAGEYAVYLARDMEKNASYLYSLSGISGEIVCLGEMPTPYKDYISLLLESDQFLSDEKGVYIVATNYQGTGHFPDYSLAVSAVPGEADSLKMIAGSGHYKTGNSEQEDTEENPQAKEAATDNSQEEEETEEGETEEGEEKEGSDETAVQETGAEAWTRLILYLSAPGEAKVVPCNAGTAGLANGADGQDLVYYDSPYSEVKLIPSFIPNSESDAAEEKFLLTAEVIGDTVYLITANGVRNEAEDVGWRMAYQLKDMRWQRVPIKEKKQDESENGREADLLAEETF